MSKAALTSTPETINNTSLSLSQAAIPMPTTLVEADRQGIIITKEAGGTAAAPTALKACSQEFNICRIKTWRP